jgi:hypothetical protein
MPPRIRSGITQAALIAATFGGFSGISFSLFSELCKTRKCRTNRGREVYHGHRETIHRNWSRFSCGRSRSDHSGTRKPATGAASGRYHLSQQKHRVLFPVSHFTAIERDFVAYFLCSRALEKIAGEDSLRPIRDKSTQRSERFRPIREPTVKNLKFSKSCQ